ncbi:MAG: hypothetical protein U9O87_01420, partial [Verrucomicrobiota bacterium]|nr:hypothetical protein [Verrucomicrobiota bacterium]
IVYHYSGKGNSRKLLKKEILKGEFLEDPSEKVSEILSKGVLKNQKIKIFCVGEDKAKSKFIFLQTDENGFLIDKTGEIIKHFDDFLNNSVTLTFFHEEYGKQKFKITRNDFLEASGADIDTKRMSYRGEMQIIATSSQKKIAPGSQIELAVEIVNNSQKYMSSLLVRSFSRHSWLNGKNFYIGGLNPGERHKCTRSIYVPRIMSEGNVFLELGIADLLGPLPEEKQKLRFTIITK